VGSRAAVGEFEKKMHGDMINNELREDGKT